MNDKRSQPHTLSCYPPIFFLSYVNSVLHCQIKIPVLFPVHLWNSSTISIFQNFRTFPVRTWIPVRCGNLWSMHIILSRALAVAKVPSTSLCTSNLNIEDFLRRRTKIEMTWEPSESWAYLTMSASRAWSVGSIPPSCASDAPCLVSQGNVQRLLHFLLTFPQTCFDSLLLLLLLPLPSSTSFESKKIQWGEF